MQQRVKNNDLGYLGNALVKRDGVLQNWTQEEVLEYDKCANDPIYFAKKYCKVISLDDGLVNLNLYPYQEKMIDMFEQNRFVICLLARQSGKTTVVCAYLLWYAMFHSDKMVIILANKGATAREILSRILLMLENIPFFLQPGCKVLNKGNIKFSNNSELYSSSTSSSSVRGKSASVLYIDEFAFVQNDAVFYTSTYPVITAGKTTRVIITSTANGIGNTFHKIWEGAVQGTNEYKPIQVDWWDVPGRDEEWKRKTISNTSQLQFDQEFGNTFVGSGNTLINANTLLGLKASEPLYTRNDVKIYEDPIKFDKDIKNSSDHHYIMLVDVCKGRGQDYSTFNIIDVTAQPFKQVATYRNNMISPLLLPDIIFKYANMYNKALVIIESNDQGSVVCNGLYYDLEYENTFVSSTITSNGVGVQMNKKIKRIGCSNIKDLIEEKKLIIVDAETIIEMSTFVAKGQSYEASNGNHDDLMMNLVMFGWFAATPMFQEITDINMKQLLYHEQMKAIEDDVTPFGFMDDGLQQEAEIDSNGDMWETNTGLI